ncbi:MAG: PepSY domain-containing protein [Deltaproteobacteria bacterium]|nr:PepSY domain-containing protein [Deltaproteobacteria bacterium]
MKKSLIIMALAIWTVSCSKTECTTEDRSQWQDEETFKNSLIEQGYKIEEFKVTDGNCYEIYGWDKDKKKVEIYFNPVDGSKVKEEAH